jgi:hypothetical protein
LFIVVEPAQSADLRFELIRKQMKSEENLGKILCKVLMSKGEKGITKEHKEISCRILQNICCGGKKALENF